jgi:hypothetical protein
MFHRWHYVIDVVAGLILALAAHVVSTRVTDWEHSRRAAWGTGPTWPPYGKKPT